VLNRLVSTAAVRLLALAMLLTVAFHAALPLAQPLQPVRGSAFSASTADVAVAPARRALPDRAAAPFLPAVLAERPVAALLLAQVRAATDPGLPDATGPPASPRLRGPSPRAPPIA